MLLVKEWNSIHVALFNKNHYTYVIMSLMASQITSLAIVYSPVCSGTDKKKKKKLRVTGLCEGNSPGPVNSPHKRPVTRKMFPFDDVIIMVNGNEHHVQYQTRVSGVYFCMLYEWTLYEFTCLRGADHILNGGSKIRKKITGPTCKFLFVFMVISAAYRSSKTTFTKYRLTPCELRNPLSKAVRDKFNGFGGHSKYNCLQDQAYFHMSLVWEIVMIFNTV